MMPEWMSGGAAAFEQGGACDTAVGDVLGSVDEALVPETGPIRQSDVGAHEIQRGGRLRRPQRAGQRGRGQKYGARSELPPGRRTMPPTSSGVTVPTFTRCCPPSQRAGRTHAGTMKTNRFPAATSKRMAAAEARYSQDVSGGPQWRGRDLGT